MSKIDFFKIFLDRSIPIYTPGEKLTGKCIIHTKEITQVKSINIQATGDCRVHWKEDKYKTGFRGMRVKYEEVIKSNEVYLNKEISLLHKLNGRDMILDAGDHSFPIEIDLPYKLVTSFEHTYGRIRYVIRGTVVTTSGAAKAVCSFSVVSDIDLNKIPGLKDSYGVSANKNVCFGICSSDTPIECNFSVPKRGFVPGEKISFSVSINNKSSRDIKELSVRLVQRVKFHSLKDKDTKLCSRDISSVKYTKRIMEKSRETWDGVLTVRPVCSSSNGSCRLITVTYVLVCNFDASGISRSTDVSIPVTIGTIPIAIEKKNLTVSYERCEPEPEEDPLPPSVNVEPKTSIDSKKSKNELQKQTKTKVDEEGNVIVETKFKKENDENEPEEDTDGFQPLYPFYNVVL